MKALFYILVSLFIPAVGMFCVMVIVPRWRERAIGLLPWMWGFCAVCWVVRALVH